MLLGSLQVLLFIAVGLLIYNDFFPESKLADTFPTALLVGVIAITTITLFVVPSIRKLITPWGTFYFKLILTIYVVALIAGLTLSGNTSEAGFDLYSPLVVVLILLQVFLLFNEYQRLKRK
ncbi:hypothetical protein [Alteribacillus iranensis]|uniref:Uncharacterized protein n=1 Tax=Alteribacillus iranensis TaxID=930128 RepID=A0A1I2E7I7_9BACI|nr:hypothetical protein [Alteribacillus iranensis]SFE88673.1 hypothetical protein SAMN05192532_105147 [Alteribacillus iranensis]